MDQIGALALHQLEVDEPLDMKFALAQKRGDKAALIHQLVEFETKVLNECLASMARDIESDNWQQFQANSKELMKASTDTGAGQICYIARSIVLALTASSHDVVPDLYVLLIEASIAFKLYLRALIVGNKGKSSDKMYSQVSSSIQTFSPNRSLFRLRCVTLIKR